MTDEQNPEINEDLIELQKCEAEKQDYLNNWKRERADFINYKKEEARRVEEIVKFANESIILELIEVLDELEVVRKNFPQEVAEKTPDWLNELDKSIGKFNEFLNRYGVERIKIGDPSTSSGRAKFDPLLHEVVEAEEKGDKLIEVRAGYTMHDRVMRPARVRIIK